MQPDEFQVSDLLSILDITRRMVEQHQLEPLLSYIAEHAIALIGAERCYIVMFSNNHGPEFRATRTRSGDIIDAPSDQVSHSILLHVQKTATPVVVSDALSDSRFSMATSVRSLSLRSVLCVPLVSYGSAIGAIYLENRSIRGRFNAKHLPILLLFSNQATVAIENAASHEDLERRVQERTRALTEANQQLEQQAEDLRQRMSELETLRDQLRELSTRDSLTSLYNRRHLHEVLPRLFSLAQRYQQQLSLAVLDLDYFKLVNDSYTHIIGDQVLCKIADILRSHTRSSDVVARYGGEEFVIVLPKTSLMSAALLCERLREAIADHPWAQIQPQLRVTISIGIASSEYTNSIEELLHMADDRLFQAKRAGRNRTVAE